MRKREWLVVVGGVVLLALFAPLDQGITDWITTPPRRHAINAALGFILGSAWFFNLAFIFGGYPNRRKLITAFAITIIGSALITHYAKQAIGRARPDADAGPASFHPPAWFAKLEVSPSLPSGHATSAAALAAILGLVFPRWRYVFWLAAAAIGLERIVDNRHYLSDVLAGGLVGVGSVCACALAMGRGAFRLDRSAPDAPRRLPIAPVVVIGAAWLLAIAAAYPFDQAVTDRLTAASLHDPLIGLVVLIGLVASWSFIFALLSTFNNARKLIGGFIAAIILSTALTHLLKFTVGRARPLLHHGSFDFTPFTFGSNVDSFPSGHTGFAVTVAILLGGYYPHARPYFLLVAGAVMLERVVNSFHFASDLVGGVLVAVISVWACRRMLGDEAFIPARERVSG